VPVRDINKSLKSAVYNTPEDLAFGAGRQAQWEARLWKPSGTSPQSASFSITGEIKHPRAKDAECCGCIHDTLVEFSKRGILKGKDQILPELIRWHGFHVDRGPWYYIETSTYFYKIYLRREGRLPPGVAYWERDRPEDVRALDHFKSTIVFGALDDDAIPAIPDFPRAPDKSDAYVYDPKTVLQRQHAWVKRCAAIVDETLIPWLNGRLPRLMALFEADMVRWFGPEILVTPDGKDSSP